MAFVVPDELVARLVPGSTVVEVGVGGRFDTLSYLAGVGAGTGTWADRDLVLVATDVSAEALEGAPAGVRTLVDDVFDPDPAVYDGAALLYAVRCPEEMQAPLARLARATGALLGLVVLKDELADLGPWVGPPRLLQDPSGRTWRVHQPRGGPVPA